VCLGPSSADGTVSEPRAGHSVSKFAAKVRGGPPRFTQQREPPADQVGRTCDFEEHPAKTDAIPPDDSTESAGGCLGRSLPQPLAEGTKNDS
jgi:hypothetical protein